MPQQADDTKRCPGCKRVLSLEHFGTDRTTRRKHKVTAHCRDCRRERTKARYASSPEMRERIARTSREWRATNPERNAANYAARRIHRRAKILAASARVRARRLGVPFSLSDREIGLLQSRIERGTCEITGAAFDLGPGRRFNSPSLHRKNPATGYQYGNIQVVCTLANAAMGDWGEQTFREVAEAWLT